MTKPCYLCNKTHCNHRQVTLKQVLSFTPEQLTMDEHRLKGFFIRLRKSRSEADAWKRAIDETQRVTSRARYIFPQFSRKDTLKILKYRPHKRLEKWTKYDWNVKASQPKENPSSKLV